MTDYKYAIVDEVAKSVYLAKFDITDEYDGVDYKRYSYKDGSYILSRRDCKGYIEFEAKGYSKEDIKSFEEEYELYYILG